MSIKSSKSNEPTSLQAALGRVNAVLKETKVPAIEQARRALNAVKANSGDRPTYQHDPCGRDWCGGHAMELPYEDPADVIHYGEDVEFFGEGFSYSFTVSKHQTGDGDVYYYAHCDTADHIEAHITHTVPELHTLADELVKVAARLHEFADGLKA